MKTISVYLPLDMECSRPFKQFFSSIKKWKRCNVQLFTEMKVKRGKPQSAEINIQHFYRHFILFYFFFLVIEL